VTDILSFLNEHRWLSNFWPCVLPPMYGVIPPTTEHAYQASKSADEQFAIEILKAPTAGAAKRLGKGAVLQKGWDEMKLDVMRQLTRYKYDQHNPELRKLLLDTRDAQIYEGNKWGDTYWGRVQLAPGVYKGENHLGQIIMDVRKEIQ
jgi:hypothetical protein